MKKFTLLVFLEIFSFLCISNLCASETTTVRIGKTVQHSSSKARVILHSDTGTFQIFALGKNGKDYPVFFNYNNSSSSFFSLLAGKKIYRLNKMNGVATKTDLLPDGCRLIYTIDKTARIYVDFFANNDGIVKISTTIKNISKKSNTFAIKAVFDTLLGEQTDRHFSTSLSPSINTEKQFTTMRDDKWIVSRNNSASVQFLLFGEGITTVDTVTLGNKDVVSLPLWTPVISTANSFDSVLSYNNSAVAINWEEHKINSSGEIQFTFYLALATENDSAFHATVTDESSSQKFKTDEKLNATKEYEKNYEKNFSNNGINGEKLSEKNVNLPSSESNNALEQTNANKNVQQESSLEKKQVIDMEYVRRLIKRINSLDESDIGFDPEELKRLNAELDAILEYIR